MINTFITGMIIGVLVSAPTGPLGILCIQRTLHKGRLNGIVTGLGATTSDLVYAVLVGFSMNFVIDFVEQYRFVIQIVGSIILFFFGYKIFTKETEKSIDDEKIGTTNRNLLSTYTSAFGLCFSNPIIIFLFIALFARFNFFSSKSNVYQVLLALSSIFVGALSWWVTLTMIVGSLRKKFKKRGLRILNFITGGVLIVLSIAGIVLGILGKSI
ncbi:MAG: LysE family translocator [Bacteroidota bacterium]|jgi:aminoacid exporter|nr:aminoacid exporter [Bacteroidetes oral taxon 274 str. F0058]